MGVSVLSIDEFKEAIYDGVVIECDSPKERNRVLEFLLALDFCVGPNTLRYLEVGHENDSAYLNPGMSDDSGRICCYRLIRDKSSIPYSSVDGIIDVYMAYIDSNLDGRTVEEFDRDFISLMC